MTTTQTPYGTCRACHVPRRPGARLCAGCGAPPAASEETAPLTIPLPRQRSAPGATPAAHRAPARRRTYTGLVAACSLMALAAVVATAVIALRPPLPTAPVPAAATQTRAPAAGAAPVVGWGGWAPGTTGYGSARPPELGANGDGTGVVWDITWQSWGGATALGRGSASWLPPAGTSATGRPTRAVVVASDLGDCHGRLGYRKVGWYFPSKGETAADAVSEFDRICSTS